MKTNTFYNSLLRFIQSHDEHMLFQLTYLVLVILAVMFLNLGFFVLLILVHMSLDIVKYRHFHKLSAVQTFMSTLHESMIDIMLLLVGLVISVYFQHSIGIVALSGFIRAESSLTRVFVMFFSKFTATTHFVKPLTRLQQHFESVHRSLPTSLTVADRLYLYLTAFCFFLLVIAPSVIGVDRSIVNWILLWELNPFYI